MVVVQIDSISSSLLFDGARLKLTQAIVIARKTDFDGVAADFAVLDIVLAMGKGFQNHGDGRPAVGAIKEMFNGFHMPSTDKFP